MSESQAFTRPWCSPHSSHPNDCIDLHYQKPDLWHPHVRVTEVDTQNCQMCGQPAYRASNGLWWHNVPYEVAVQAAKAQGTPIVHTVKV